MFYKYLHTLGLHNKYITYLKYLCLLLYIFLFVCVQSHPTGRGDFERLLNYNGCSLPPTKFGDFEHGYGFKKRIAQYTTYIYEPMTSLSFDIHQNAKKLNIKQKVLKLTKFKLA